jgi:S-adenosylmethionine:tRNA ribosyltransferase-isomerase
MKRSVFSYDLPEALIAQYPLQQRTDSRLLCLDRNNGTCIDEKFNNLPDLLRPGDLLVFNDTRVIPARIFGTKASGGKVEILIERVLDDNLALAQIRASKSPKPGGVIILDGGDTLVVERREQEFFVLRATGATSVTGLLEKHGHIPLPPYIKRQDEASDRQRYQTVYARNPGAVAAPTAGLHFSEATLASLKANHIDIDFVTLHVGAGTFQPVRTDNIKDHVMHNEWFRVGKQLCEKIHRVKLAGGRVIAVGTTAVRCLESAAVGTTIAARSGQTNIFIYPGYEFKIIDGLLTNFHLPESTLLMLVCAFAGTEQVLSAYEHAVTQQYRFFSYGDAMLIV